jgi:hypothetical protein
MARYEEAVKLGHGDIPGNFTKIQAQEALHALLFMGMKVTMALRTGTPSLLKDRGRFRPCIKSRQRMAFEC